MIWGAAYGGGILYVYLSAPLRKANRAHLGDRCNFLGLKGFTPVSARA